MMPGRSAPCLEDIRFISSVNSSVSILATCTHNSFQIPKLTEEYSPFIYNNHAFFNSPISNEKCNHHNHSTKLPDFVVPMIASLSAFVLILLCIIIYLFRKLRSRQQKGKHVVRPTKFHKAVTLLKSNLLPRADTPDNLEDQAKTITILSQPIPERRTGGSSSWRAQGSPGDKYRVVISHSPIEDDELIISPGDVVVATEFFEDNWVHVKRVESSQATVTKIILQKRQG